MAVEEGAELHLVVVAAVEEAGHSSAGVEAVHLGVEAALRSAEVETAAEVQPERVVEGQSAVAEEAERLSEAALVEGAHSVGVEAHSVEVEARSAEGEAHSQAAQVGAAHLEAEVVRLAVEEARLVGEAGHSWASEARES